MSQNREFIAICQEALVELKEFRDEVESLFGVTTNIKTAQEIMGEENFLGPKEVFNTFGVKLKESEIPRIPFSIRELETAASLSQMLILRISNAKDGSPLTMKKMNEELEGRFKTAGRGKILYNSGWYKNEKFFTTGPPTKSKAQWALVSKEVIPNSTSKNYLEQTELLVDYLQKEIMPTLSKAKQAQYKEAVTEFNSKKEMIQSMEEWIKANKQLAELQINQLTRQSPSQVLYDLLLAFDNKGERFLEAGHTWTKALRSSGRLVRVGVFDAGGALVFDDHAVDRYVYLGAVFSRTF